MMSVAKNLLAFHYKKSIRKQAKGYFSSKACIATQAHLLVGTDLYYFCIFNVVYVMLLMSKETEGDFVHECKKVKPTQMHQTVQILYVVHHYI
jgi:hypothetical protein